MDCTKHYDGGRLVTWIGFRALLLLVTLLAAGPGLSAKELREEIIRDLGQWPMYASPLIKQPANKPVHAPGLLPLWLAALGSTEIDLQRQAAEAVPLAVEQNVPNIEAMAPGLVELIQQPGQHPLVLRPACTALIALDYKRVEPELLKLASKGQLSLSQVIEPGLAVWNTPGAVEMWKSRLEAGQSSQQLTRLAILCLRTVEEKSSLPRLAELTSDVLQPVGIRIEAARSFSQLADVPAVAAVDRLRQSSWQGPRGWLNRYLAAYLLTPSAIDDPQAMTVLHELALDNDGSIAAVALEALRLAAPEQVVMLASQRRDHPDGKVRAILARAIHQQIDIDRVGVLVAFLEDPHRPLRLELRGWLIAMLTDKELGVEVAVELLRLQPAMQWRATEQLMRIMVAVPEIADREWIAIQINHQRPEVFVTAAWAIRRLKIRQALPILHERVTAGMRQVNSTNESVVPAEQQDDLIEQICHAMQAFGEMDFVAAEPNMFRLVRKNPVYPFVMRASAIWAIGQMSAGQPNKQVKTGNRSASRMASLAEELQARIADNAPMPPEGVIVKRMAAVALARMKSTDSLPVMEQVFLSAALSDTLKWTLAWAMADLGGETIDVPEFIEVESQGWFLETAGN